MYPSQTPTPPQQQPAQSMQPLQLIPTTPDDGVDDIKSRKGPFIALIILDLAFLLLVIIMASGPLMIAFTGMLWIPVTAVIRLAMGAPLHKSGIFEKNFGTKALLTFLAETIICSSAHLIAHGGKICMMSDDGKTTPLALEQGLPSLLMLSGFLAGVLWIETLIGVGSAKNRKKK